LQSNIDGALEAYQAAVVKSPQREIQLLCLHEVGWCHLIHLDWNQAYEYFFQLKLRSRWSRSFYTYLAAGMFPSEYILSITSVSLITGTFNQTAQNYCTFWICCSDPWRHREPNPLTNKNNHYMILGGR